MCCYFGLLISSVSSTLSFLSIIFEQDKLMTVASDSSSSGSSGNWLFKNKEHGKTSAAASLV